MKHLSDLGEVSNIAEAENGALLFALNHRIHVSLFDDVRANNLRACASEDDGQKGSDFDDCVADYSGLELCVEVELLFGG